jgi:hypothetical protein
MLARHRDRDIPDLADERARAAALGEALARFDKAHAVLELANDGKNADGAPFKPYQWEGAQENAQIDYWDAREKLLERWRALVPRAGGDGEGTE